MGISKLSQVIRNILPLKYCGAVIVAAGTASRMQGIDKVMAELGGEPMILRTVRAFENCDVIGQIVIVTREDLVEKIQALCAKYPKVTAVTIGGADRAESVRNGLKLLSPKVRLAAIHDGARPLVTDAVIDRTVRAAHRYGAAAPGVPVKDTVKVVRGGFVKSTRTEAPCRRCRPRRYLMLTCLRVRWKRRKRTMRPLLTTALQWNLWECL